jgi:predicted membrane channel-forming protein YqfA (hemolysin III family)
MDDMQNRETLLKKPFFQVTFWISSPVLIFYFTSLMLSTLTVMAAGIPAAIFERVTGRKESDEVSLYIWLGCSILLSIPALMAAAQNTKLPS